MRESSQANVKELCSQTLLPLELLDGLLLLPQERPRFFAPLSFNNAAAASLPIAFTHLSTLNLLALPIQKVVTSEHELRGPGTGLPNTEFVTIPPVILPVALPFGQRQPPDRPFRSLPSIHNKSCDIFRRLRHPFPSRNHSLQRAQRTANCSAQSELPSLPPDQAYEAPDTAGAQFIIAAPGTSG